MPPMISIAAVTKRYKSGLVALDSVDLEIAKGEIFALLGPNGAGKTTLIGVTCGTVSMTSGRILIDGHDVVSDYRAARTIVGLVPQEIALDIFSSVLHSVSFSRQAVRPPCQSCVHRAAAARPVAVGQARYPNRRIVGRHEAAGDDRQGAQPRTRRALPR